MIYDKERLLEDADAYTVASYIGMDTSYKSNRHWILCPGHEKRLGKKDSAMTNCYLTKKGYVCHACGVHVGIVNMVTEYYESELAKKITFPEALGIIADSLGGRKFYLTDSNDDKEIEKKFKLSSKDYEVIGIPQNMYLDHVVNYCFDPEEAKEMKLSFEKVDNFENSGVYKMTKREHISLQMIEELYPDVYWNIVKKAALKRKTELTKILNEYCNKSCEKSDFFLLFNSKGIIDDKILYQVRQTVIDLLSRLNEILLEISDEDEEDDEILNEIEREEKPKEKVDYFALFG